MNFMTFHSVWNFIIPTDELIFFRGVVPGRYTSDGFLKDMIPNRLGIYDKLFDE